MTADATTQPDASSEDEAAKPIGRPTKLTPELADALCEARQNGHSQRGAAHLCGISYSTLKLWLSRGEEADAPPEFSAFSARFTRAHAHVIGLLVNAAIQDALGGSVVKKVERELPDGSVIREEQVTPPNGKVALEVASRLDPDWRGVKAVELSGPDGGPVEVAHEVEILEGLVSRVEAVKARKAAEAVSRCDDVA